MKDRKKKIANPEASTQSYIIRFQSSPVDIEKSKEKLIWKLVKFFHSSMT